MWRNNALAFFGRSVMDCCWMIILILSCFKLLPTFPFCTSPTDPCSCQGAGFEIYTPICNEITEANGTVTLRTKAAAAEYPGIFEALAGNITIILGGFSRPFRSRRPCIATKATPRTIHHTPAVSISAIGLVILLFSFARTCYALTKVDDKRAKAEKLVSQLERKTAEVTRQLKLNTLNAQQGKMVDEKAQSFEAQVPPYFKLALADIQFEKLLGSGA